LAEPILIPVAAGELFDKKTILEIKRQRILDPQQLANVERELGLLTAVGRTVLAGLDSSEPLERLESELREINAALWDLENAVRAHEKSGVFGEGFVDTARAIYAGNDRRAAVKRQINLLLNSAIVEEKSHTGIDPAGAPLKEHD
jgi:hypothetical protein